QIILDAVEKMVPVTKRKLSAQPNAGMPRDVSGRSMYMASPEYMATYAHHLIQAGAKVIGGCCGTTPEHLRAIVHGIRPLVPRMHGRGPRAEDREQATPAAEATTATSAVAPRPSVGVPPIPFATRSQFAAKIARGEM